MNAFENSFEKPKNSSPRGRNEEEGFVALAKIIQRRKMLFGFLILCSMTAVFLIHAWLPIYEARSTLIFETTSSSSLQALSAKLGTSGIQEDETKELARYATRLDAPDFYLQVARELKKLNVELPMFNAEMRSSKLRVATAFSSLLHLPTKRSSIKDLSDEDIARLLETDFVYFTPTGADRISIVVRSADKESATVVANIVADMSVAVLLSDGLKDLDEAQKYIDDQVDTSEKAIHEIEEELVRLKVNTGMVGESNDGLTKGIQIRDLQLQLSQLNLQYDSNHNRIKSLKKELEEQEKIDPSSYNPSVDPDNRYGLPKKIEELEREDGRIMELRASTQQALTAVLQGSRTNDEQKIYDLRKRMEFQYAIFQELKKESFQIQMKRIGQKNKVRVFSHVQQTSVQRSDSLPTKLAIAFILAIFGGLPIAMLWELIRPYVHDGKDLREAGLTYLGGVPRVAKRFAMNRKSGVLRLCNFESDTELAMALILVRSRLLFLSDRRKDRTKVITITSGRPGDGKSFFSQNLAASFGHMGRRTLLVDCDLRKAQTSDFFGYAKSEGLGEVIMDQKKFGEVVCRKVCRGVDLLPAGMIRNDITGLFASEGLTNLMIDLREVYDHIIVDTPSLIEVPDTPLISRAADLPLLIASVHKTTQQDLDLALDRLRALYSGDICAVLNRTIDGKTPLYVVHSGGRKIGDDAGPVKVAAD